MKRCLSYRRMAHATNLFCLLLLLWAGSVAARLPDSMLGRPLHGLSLYGPPALPADFVHLPHVRPDAPKGGHLRLGTIGTFDSLNPFILRGIPAEGLGLVTESLLATNPDEAFAAYGLLAETVTISRDRLSVTFALRPEARFHNGAPVTAADVVWSFETLRRDGLPFYRSYYADVASAAAIDDRTVRFVLQTADNAELPLLLGQFPILQQADWHERDFSKTSLSPFMGSGPYQVAEVKPGEQIRLMRVADWWGRDLPLHRGRYNFDSISYVYYRDATIALEAFLADQYDIRPENIAKNWATAYDVPAVRDGRIQRLELPNHLPAGMQGWVLNLRRPQFQDRRVREALSLAFDFEWANRNVAFGAYRRSRSYFENSELAATGLPTPAELELLEPYRDQLPAEIFTTAFAPPATDGSGTNRANLRRASALLAEAGWRLEDGVLRNQANEAFAFTILDQTAAFDRWAQPWLRNLERLGIHATFRLVDSAQYQKLVQEFDYDVISAVFAQSLSPGNEQRDTWQSAKAEMPGSRNLIGLRDPVVDALVERLIAAPTRADLITACRALDRVLQWGFYVVPHWHVGTHRLALWDRFGRPDSEPRYGLGILDRWWAAPPAVGQP